MTALLAWLSARNKALMALIAGVLNWAYFVVDSPSKAITAKEWLLLGGVGAAAVGVHQIANSAPLPAYNVTISRDATNPRVTHSTIAPVPSPATTSAPDAAVVPPEAPVAETSA